MYDVGCTMYDVIADDDTPAFSRFILHDYLPVAERNV